MYACIPEIGGRFFEGVCVPSNATAHSCDPPPNAKEPEPHCQDSGPKWITSRPTYLKLGEYLDRWLAVQHVHIPMHPPTKPAFLPRYT
jgi:hypothetical protein